MIFDMSTQTRHIGRLIFYVLLLFGNGIFAQSSFFDFISMHEEIKEPVMNTRFFKHQEVDSLIMQYVDQYGFSERLLGQSVEGRNIRMLTVGKGRRSVLLWTQMHGDEPTATMAVFDILRFFGSNMGNEAWKSLVLDELTLHIIPMLNPDGSAVFKRRNALDIDLNRDAQDKLTPEARILWKASQDVQAVFGFNLHDQSPYYTVGESGLQTQIAFLAPPYMANPDSLNDNRANAMRLIAMLDRQLQQIIPGKVARFSDEYEVRAFGDQFQATGMSTILIESGGDQTESAKQYNRKLHFAMLLQAFEHIARKTYLYEGLANYYSIPPNRRNAVDILLKNVVMEDKGKFIYQNASINRSLFLYNNYREANEVFLLAEFGNLSNKVGFKEIDLYDKTFRPGKITGDYTLLTFDLASFLDAGFTGFFVQNEKELNRFKHLPIPVYYFPIMAKKGRLNRPFDFFYEEEGVSKLLLNGEIYEYKTLIQNYGNKRLIDFVPNESP
jgi:hypothetical protein